MSLSEDENGGDASVLPEARVMLLPLAARRLVGHLDESVSNVKVS